jgi:hypothetical protein
VGETTAAVVGDARAWEQVEQMPEAVIEIETEACR